MILITSVIKGNDKFYPQLFLEEVLVAKNRWKVIKN